MQSSTGTIKSLLKRYEYYSIMVENSLGGDELKQKLSFLEKAISALREEDFKIMKEIYLDGLSVTQVAKNCFCARRTVYYRCERIIKRIAEVYDGQFKP